MIVQTLFLTANEESVWNTLPDALREGWSVESDVMEYIDSPQRRRIRLSNVHVLDPRLKEIRASFNSSLTVEAAQKMLEQIDLRDMNDHDVREILYALGPDVLSGMITVLLKSAETDDDVRNIAAYSTIRNLFFGTTNA